MKILKKVEYKTTPEGKEIKIINHEFGKDRCFICGSNKKKLTMHHTLPKRLKPLRNVTVPLCLECHRDIHELKGEYDGEIIKKNQVLEETSVSGIFYKKEIPEIAVSTGVKE